MRSKPIAVIQNVANDGPGHFANWAERQGHTLDIIEVWRGHAVPATIDSYAGLCVLGGPMSVNDDLAHLRDTERLIRAAMQAEVPVLGHCLGGQLMASALGARIRRAPQAEIGWIPIDAHAADAALEWFGTTQFPIFHWHSDSFDLPPGAVLLGTSPYCANQAFSIGEKHIAMQFHCEITTEKIAAWTTSHEGQAEIATHTSPGVQSIPGIHAATPSALPVSQQVAEAIYHRWSKNLRID
ncbi:GMP synthase [Niveibacterium umoris]|uniref:GMP synthase-like glutamine amidotransferase n=1 Tax=Niveibacterium umoris TaxID=1193620 RepID=A0A840BKB5_9RHOO|nr:type 1 glutamine amidotransferase [Niveibacterium umoris]MBB4010987.1 GMP synthase-like glutamine amidotransferase [Niveibacterium umoris]